MAHSFSEAIQTTMDLIAQAIARIEQNHGEPDELHNMRAHLVELLRLMERSPGIDAAADDLDAAATGFVATNVTAARAHEKARCRDVSIDGGFCRITSVMSFDIYSWILERWSIVSGRELRRDASSAGFEEFAQRTCSESRITLSINGSTCTTLLPNCPTTALLAVIATINSVFEPYWGRRWRF